MQKFFLYTLIVIAFIWIRSGGEKLLSGDFPQTLSYTLSHFAKNNPYPLFQSFLTSFSIPNAEVIGYIVMASEISIGLVIGFCAFWIVSKRVTSRLFLYLFLVALSVGILLNINFWLASGYLSPSTDGLNLLMCSTQILGVCYVIQLVKEKNHG